jgi:hypothetical protein
MGNHHMTQTECAIFETPNCMLQFSLLLASSHHHPMMKSNYLFLLLLLVLLGYPESSQHVKPPYSFAIAVAVYPNSSSAKLGVFTPVQPQNEVSKNLPHYEVSINPSQYVVYRIALPQNEVSETALPQLGEYEIAPVNCQLLNRVKNIVEPWC